jgi:hypothetical protein
VVNSRKEKEMKKQKQGTEEQNRTGNRTTGVVEEWRTGQDGRHDTTRHTTHDTTHSTATEQHSMTTARSYTI